VPKALALHVTHPKTSKQTLDAVRTLLMMKRRESGLWGQVPKEILFLVCEQLVVVTVGNDIISEFHIVPTENPRNRRAVVLYPVGHPEKKSQEFADLYKLIEYYKRNGPSSVSGLRLGEACDRLNVRVNLEAKIGESNYGL
jgi:hypothetical protein